MSAVPLLPLHDPHFTRAEKERLFEISLAVHMLYEANGRWNCKCFMQNWTQTNAPKHTAALQICGKPWHRHRVKHRESHSILPTTGTTQHCHWDWKQEQLHSEVAHGSTGEEFTTSSESEPHYSDFLSVDILYPITPCWNKPTLHGQCKGHWLPQTTSWGWFGCIWGKYLGVFGFQTGNL